MGQNFAIVIGINRYDNFQDLKYAHRDAERVRDWCGEMGFARCCFFAEGAETIDIDGARFASEPSYGKVIRFLRQFENIGLELGDTVWFFFAGHGTRWRESDYLMLSDSDPQQGENKPDPALAIHELTAHLRGTGAGNVVLMLDACRSLGGVRDGVGIGGERQQGVITFYSCAPHQQALEIDEIRAGAFTEVLLEGLRRQGEGNCATVGRLRSHVQSRVPQLTEQYRGRSQNPVLAVDPEGKQDLILFPARVTDDRDWMQLKNAAYRAQNQHNYPLAKSLWLRVIDGLGSDSDAVEAICEIDRMTKPGTTSPPVPEKKTSAATRSAATKPKSPPTPKTETLPRTDSGSPIAFPFSRRRMIQILGFGGLGTVGFGVSQLISQSSKPSQTSLIPPSVFSKSDVLPDDFMFYTFKTVQLSPTGEIVDQKTKTGNLYLERLTASVSVEMVKISEGKFIMGSPASEVGRSDDEGPQHEVNVASFFMSKTPITQAQWDAVVKLPKVKIDLPSNPSKFKGPKRPVEKVNWWQAEEFCKRLGVETKRDYRLPSEAEWEYACRSATTTPFYFGETLSSEIANYDASRTYGSGVKGMYREQTTDVESFSANAWGLYDMHGNVWEWCADHGSKNYETALKDSNPFLSKDTNSDRVVRGGAWLLDPVLCRSALRRYASPSNDYDSLGLRLVCSASRTGN